MNDFSFLYDPKKKEDLPQIPLQIELDIPPLKEEESKEEKDEERVIIIEIF